MTYVFKEAKGLSVAQAPIVPGTWRPWLFGRERFRAAVVSCPKCVGGLSLRKNHRILADGTVTPSLVCTHEGCTFHEFVRLEGWTP